MATIRFARAEAYVSGDLMIQIHIDGNKAGTLIGAKPLDLELEPGTYMVQATMFTLKGKAVVLEVDAADQKATVAVSGTRIVMFQSPWQILVTLVAYCTPWSPVGIAVIKTAVLLLFAGYISYRNYKLRPSQLRLDVTDGIISESPASSRRLSLLR